MTYNNPKYAVKKQKYVFYCKINDKKVDNNLAFI